MAEELSTEEPLEGAIEADALDRLPVGTIALIDGVRVIEPVRSGPPAIVQAAAVAATSFVAGAAAAAVLGRRRTRHALAAPRAVPQLPAPQAGGTQTFVVQVRQIRRPTI
jgi:hypothetical protein